MDILIETGRQPSWGWVNPVVILLAWSLGVPVWCIGMELPSSEQPHALTAMVPESRTVSGAPPLPVTRPARTAADEGLVIACSNTVDLAAVSGPTVALQFDMFQGVFILVPTPTMLKLAKQQQVIAVGDGRYVVSAQLAHALRSGTVTHDTSQDAVFLARQGERIVLTSPTAMRNEADKSLLEKLNQLPAANSGPQKTGCRP